MKRQSLLPLGNGALYLATCVLVGTGLLLELRLDEEDGASQLLGMGRDDWGEIHVAFALTFVAVTALHLVLNWAWIKATVTRVTWALPLLAVGLGLVAALLLWPSDRNAAGRTGKTGHHQADDD